MVKKFRLRGISKLVAMYCESDKVLIHAILRLDSYFNYIQKGQIFVD